MTLRTLPRSVNVLPPWADTMTCLSLLVLWNIVDEFGDQTDLGSSMYLWRTITAHRTFTYRIMELLGTRKWVCKNQKGVVCLDLHLVAWPIWYVLMSEQNSVTSVCLCFHETTTCTTAEKKGLLLWSSKLLHLCHYCDCWAVRKLVTDQCKEQS